MMKPKGLYCLTTIALLAIASGTAIDSAAARSAFDGMWNVTISTERGACERGRNLNIEIRDGALIYSGPGSVDVKGHVTKSGQVQVHVASGAQNASGTGRLSTATGSGTWRGSGESGGCAGRWSAQKG